MAWYLVKHIDNFTFTIVETCIYSLTKTDISCLTLVLHVDRGSRVRFPVGAGNFSLHHLFQNGFWGPPNLISNGYQGLFSWG
jgi:hypothetical protein